MDEFIIWDDGIHTFEEAMADKASSGGFVPYDYIIKCDGYLKGALNGEYPSFKDIGLKDINGKSIYADSSIVEFNNSINPSYKYKGVFYYLPIEARYMIKVFNKNTFEIWFYNPDKILNLQIVDTVQQNKLGLIK